MNKFVYVFGAILIAGFAALGMLEMIKAQTPYVTTVRQARSYVDRPIQFVGSIVHSRTGYDQRTDELVFELRDAKGDAIAVRYRGVKPASFDSSERAVVGGRFYGREFAAEHVLLKGSSERRGK